jgi:subtilisin family serine protease
MLQLLPGGPRVSIASFRIVAAALALTPAVTQPLAAQAPPSSTTTVVVRGGVATTAAGPMGPAFHPSRVLVRFRPGRAVAVLPGTPSFRNFPGTRELYLVETPPGLSVAEAVRRYRANPNVLYAEPDYIVTAVGNPTDPLWAQQWDMVKISAPAAWDTQTNASDVVVAIVDTGIDFTHPDLQPNLWTAADDSTISGTALTWLGRLARWRTTASASPASIGTSNCSR